MDTSNNSRQYVGSYKQNHVVCEKKKIPALNGTVDQMNIIDIYRAFHLRFSDYTFLSRSRETFSRKDLKLGHKTSLNKFKKTEIIPSIFSYHNGFKLEIHGKKEVKKPTKIRRLNNILLKMTGSERK